MFVQSDGQQPTSPAKMNEEDAEESQQSATDDNPELPRPPLYTKWNPDSGMLEVKRGYRVPTPDGTYVTRNWTEVPPARHIFKYEGTIYGDRRIKTRIYNPRIVFFELKRSPVVIPTASSVRRLLGTTHASEQPLSSTRTDYKPKHSTNTETPHITDSTMHKSSKDTHRDTKLLQITIYVVCK